jgi:putative endonuclease
MTSAVKTVRRKFQRLYFVYLPSNLRRVFCVGLTDDLRKRILQHKSGTFDGFTKRYCIVRLMYFETYNDSKFTEFREKQIKKYRREKKIALFRECNPQWKDLSPELFGPTRKTRGAIADNELGADSPPNLISTDMDPSLHSGLKRKP